MDFIEKSIAQNKVVVFGIPWQTDTRLVKFWLDMKKVKYWACEIDQLDIQVGLQEVFYICTGGHTLLPYVFMHGRYVGSRHEIMELEANNELDKYLDEPTVTTV